MYIKEVVTEMENKHQKSLMAHRIMATTFDNNLLSGQIPNHTLADVSLFFINKFHKSLLSLRILVVSGMEEDAIVILRTLLEASITLAYISKDPEVRVQLYIEYSAVSRKRLYTSSLKYYPDIEYDVEVIQSIEEDYEKVKNNYKKKFQWSDITLHNMAIEVGMGYWYEVIYQPDSSYVHTGISASNKMMYSDSDGLVLAVGPQVFSATDILAKSCELSRNILRCALMNMSKDYSEVEDDWSKARILLSQEFENNRK